MQPILDRVQAAIADRPRRPITFWWFAVPMATFGFATFLMVLLASIRLRSWLLKFAALGYLALTFTFFIGVQMVPPLRSGRWGPYRPWTTADTLIVLPWLFCWLVGTAHVLVLQRRVRATVPRPVRRPPGVPAVDPALVAAHWRVARRREARAILATDPALATELRIGRPDLPRQYDDGGLVDVNRVPAEALAWALEIDPATAQALVRQRDRQDGFVSAEELIVYCPGLTTAALAAVRDRLVFVAL
jgi:hypothetical protein